MSDNTVADDGTPATPAKPKNRVGRPIDPNSVLAKCKTLFVTLAQSGKTRPEILQEFVDRFGLKKGSAQVYYHDSKNAAEAAGHQITVKRSSSKRVKTDAVIASANTSDDASISG